MILQLFYKIFLALFVEKFFFCEGWRRNSVWRRSEREGDEYACLSHNPIPNMLIKSACEGVQGATAKPPGRLRRGETPCWKKSHFELNLCRKIGKFHFELYRTYVERIGTSIFIDDVAIHCHGNFDKKVLHKKSHIPISCLHIIPFPHEKIFQPQQHPIQHSPAFKLRASRWQRLGLHLSQQFIPTGQKR